MQCRAAAWLRFAQRAAAQHRKSPKLGDFVVVIE